MHKTTRGENTEQTMERMDLATLERLEAVNGRGLVGNQMLKIGVVSLIVVAHRHIFHNATNSNWILYDFEEGSFLLCVFRPLI